jgi:succinate-semialdehyde dehydrogenase/glutarate-semialdehyde dehydrogenase
VLELGGSDPFIVLADADLEKAAETGAFSRTINTGQTCISAKRFIVQKDVADQFSALLKEKLAAKIVGDPMDEKTEIGPMARADLREDLHGQVSRSVREGASVVLGGEVPEGPGNFYPVTLLKDVGFNIVAAVEETFGPVTPIMTVDSADQALEIANSSAYGLGGSIWTKDLERAHDLVRRLEVGNAFVNGLVKSDPRLPFGGIKNSGYGRELAEEGIREFMNIKSVWMAK